MYLYTLEAMEASVAGLDAGPSGRVDFALIDGNKVRSVQVEHIVLEVLICIYYLGVLRPKCRHCGVYLGMLAEFSTKIHVISTQDDIYQNLHF